MTPQKDVQPANTASPHRRLWSYELMGVVAVVILALLFAFIPRRHQPNRTGNSTSVTQAIAVPDSFFDFSGHVVSIQDHQVEITASSFDRQGKLTTTTYQVGINDKTQLEQSDSATRAQNMKPISLSDIKANDNVVVFSDANLATVTTFTATKLIRYQP